MSARHCCRRPDIARFLIKLWPAALFVFLLPKQLAAHEPPLSPERQASLRSLLHQECGSCHGLKLNGGLGPALTSDALQGQSAAQVALTIMHGWNRFLHPSESLWLADFLLRTPDKKP